MVLTACNSWILLQENGSRLGCCEVTTLIEEGGMGHMPDESHYVIRGGVEGRERLRVLSSVMHETTMALLDRVGIAEGQTCLDVGCGGGDVTVELARRVGSNGAVVGVDIDETKLEIARSEAEEGGLEQVEFRRLDIRTEEAETNVDVVYARFLLTHLDDPSGAIAAFRHHVRPGGKVVVEDIDFSGYFTYPASRAFDRYRELYCATVEKRGGDPNIGPRLPVLLQEGGLRDVEIRVVQPMATRGNAKLINAITMENIRGAVLGDGLATAEEIDTLVRDLYRFAENPNTVAGTPRIVQAWGSRSVD